MNEPRLFILTVRSEGRHSTPVEVRLRSFLKHALRCFGLRVVSIERGSTPPAHTPHAQAREATATKSGRSETGGAPGESGSP